MRVLTVTSLYPNAVQPQRGLFVRERLRRLRRYHDVSLSVVAPVPWFPSKATIFGDYAAMARVPYVETDDGEAVFHPRFFQLPKVGAAFAPKTFAAAVLREIRRRAIVCDVVDAHFLFPDGVAAVLVAETIERPLLMTARGSDVNIIAKEAVAGRWIRWALRRADSVAAVSSDLAQQLRCLSGGRDVETIANGVDRQLFSPSADRAALRRRLGFSTFTALSVGNLIELKGHALVIDAVASVPDCHLVIVGSGPLQDELESKIRAQNLGARVRLVGSLPQDRLADFYRAADVLVLASRFEGLPNVILESLASGTRVVATATPGAREVIGNDAAGVLCERTANAIASALRRVKATDGGDAGTIRASVDRFDWRTCADRHHGALSRILSGERD